MLPEAVPFQFFDSSDLAVTHIDVAGIRTELASAAFVVAGNGLSRAGTIRATGIWPADDVFLVERRTERVQKADIKPHEPVPAVGVTQQLDRTMFAVQEQDSANADTASRALMMPPGESARDLPGKAERAGKVLVFELGTGEPTTKPIGSFPAGPPGGSDNTYSSYAEMQASDPTRKSARLVGDTDIPAHPDGPYNNPTEAIGGWVPQTTDGIAYTPPAVAVITRSAEDRLADSIRAHDHGAVGDGGPNLLAGRFPTLAAARDKYPDCTIDSLADRGDGVAIEAAINRAKKYYLLSSQGGYLTRAVAQLRHGRYTISRPIRLPNSVELRGAGAGATIIDAQNHKLNGPLLINADQGSVDMRVSGLSLHGGTHGVKIDSGEGGQVNSLRFGDVSMRLQTNKCFEVNRLLQQGDFEHCTFADAVYGIYCPRWTTNAVRFTQCGFEDIKWIPVTIRTGEAISFIGGRFEAGGNNGYSSFTGSISGTTLTVTSQFANMIYAGGLLLSDGPGTDIADGTSIIRQITGLPGEVGTYQVNISQNMGSRKFVNRAATIDLDQATPQNLGCQVSFRDVYFENTAQWLLRDKASRDGVSFNHCHFTQALNDGGFPVPYQCYSDGVVEFGSNDYTATGIIAPAKILSIGQNSKLIGDTVLYTSRAKGGVAFRSQTLRAKTALVTRALTATRAGATGPSMMTGKLTVSVIGYNGSFGAPIHSSKTFGVNLFAQGNVDISFDKTVQLTTGNDAGNEIDIVLSTNPNEISAGIDISVQNISGNTPASVWWSFQEESSSFGDGFDVTCG